VNELRLREAVMYHQQQSLSEDGNHDCRKHVLMNRKNGRFIYKHDMNSVMKVFRMSNLTVTVRVSIIEVREVFTSCNLMYIFQVCVTT